MSLNQDVFFNEEAYSESNPDVARAISAGTIKSGWLHYLQFGFKERRGGVSGTASRTIEQIYALPLIRPPEHLISRVHGVPDHAAFNQTGRMIALDVFRAIHDYTDLKSCRKIYEFGCGCGRVIYPLLSILPEVNFWGSDIDREAVDWLNHAREVVGLGALSLFSNGDMPPLAISAETFDLVYAISVFTHLPVAMQDAWIAELWRITKKGSYILLTTQNENLILQHIDEAERGRLLAEGVFYKAFQSTEGLPDYYQATWHTKEYLEKKWAHLVELVCHVPNGIAGHQDLTLYRRR